MSEAIGRVGGSDERPEYALGESVEVALSNSILVIADFYVWQIRIFDHSGRFIKSVGREGRGPGEFVSPLLYVTVSRNDVVRVWDSDLRRLTSLDMSGNVLQLARLDDHDPGQPRANIFVGSFPDGSWVMKGKRTLFSLRAEARGERRDSVRYVLIDSAGRYVQEVDRIPGSERFLWRSGATTGIMGLPLGRSEFEAVGNRHFWYGSNDSLVLHAVGPDGRNSVVRLGISQSQVTRAMREALRADWESRRGGWPKSPDFDDLPQRATLTSFDRLVVDREGRPWVRLTPGPVAEAATWLVLDEVDGARAKLVIPVELEVRAVASSALATVTEDDLGRQTVTVYRVLK